MNNNIIKLEDVKENVLQDLKSHSENLYLLEESVVTSFSHQKIEGYVHECDEYNKNKKIVLAHNMNPRLIEKHYEIDVFKEDNKEGVCPFCDQIVNTVHDYRTRYIQDVAENGLPVFLKYRYKRFYCPDCCKNFPEKNNDFPPKAKYTKRLYFQILRKLKENTSRTTIAREEHVSPTLVKKVLDMCPFNEKELGSVLCIDEFKGNMGVYKDNEWKLRKYQTLIKNPVSGEVINVLESRDYNLLVTYFSNIPSEQREKVEYYICDMNSSFMSMCKRYFPNAKLVIDRFHYTKAVVEAFENIRKSVQSKLSKNQRIKFKNSRFMLLKHNEDIEKVNYGEDIYKLDDIFEIAPSLVLPYILLQDFYEINKCASRKEAKIKLQKFYRDVENCNEPEFIAAMKTLKKHEKAILESYDCEYTNAYAEGTNNLVKVMKRVAYGLRNLERFKKRLGLIVENNIEVKKRNKENKEKRNEIYRLRRELKRKKLEEKAASESAA